MSQPSRAVVVVGLGNALRGDDGVGLEVVARLADLEWGGEIEVLLHEAAPVALLDVWHRTGAVLLVDSVRTKAPAGTITRIDAASEPIPMRLGGTSSHGVGVAETIELARALGTLPPVVVVYGVEGASYEAGAPLSAAVQAAIAPAAGAVRREALGLIAAARRRRRARGPQPAPAAPPP